MNFKKIINYLTSRKFALILLGALIFLSITGVIIPQDSPASQQDYLSWSTANPDRALFFAKIGLTKLFTSPLFLFISFFLFLSILLCTIEQVKVRKKVLKLLPLFNTPNIEPLEIELTPSRATPNDVKSILERNGYQILTNNTDDKIIRAARFTFGYWGSAILHFGFILIMLGALISGLTKMEGYIFLGEGQPFVEESQSYWKVKKGPLFLGHKGFNLTLDRIKVEYPKKELPYTSSLQFTIQEDNQQISRFLPSNEVLNIHGVKFFPDLHGYATALVFTNETNQVVYSSFFHLKTITHSNTNESYEDSSSIPELGLETDIKFFPDYLYNNGDMTTKSWKPINPALYITIKKDSKIIYKGPLKLKDEVQIGNYWVHFPEYRSNNGFNVVSDNGKNIIFAGFWVSLLGLLLIYQFNPRQIWITLDSSSSEKKIYIWGKAERFPHSFQQELTILAQRIENVVKGETDV